MLEQIPPNSIEHLYGPEEVPYEADELVLLCLLRDGRPYLKSFVEHHFSLGIKHLFFLDNGSTDGTVEALKGYENVTVLHTGLPFERYELSMRQYLVERFCQKGRWCLYADMDEVFDYSYSDVVSLSSLLRYLNERSYTAVVAQMLDMFPEEPLSGSRASTLLDEPLKERHRFYDISNVQRTGIREHRPARNNTYGSDDIEAFYSGLRNALFGTRKFLTRFGLMFSDGRLKPFAGSGHWVDEARVADLTCVYFHYKFLDGYLRMKAAEGLEDQHHWNTPHYNKYLKALDSNLSLQLKQESARELRSVNELVENHFLVVSEEYMMLVYDQQHKNGARRAPRQGEPGRSQDEGVFERTRAQAKVQTLRAKRLQLRLEQLSDQHQSELQKLREHNQRELQKLRGQYQRRIEKLSRRLARTKKKTKKNNRALMKQLRSIRASRSWRLLNKLARLQAKVLRRNATKQGASQRLGK